MRFAKCLFLNNGHKGQDLGCQYLGDTTESSNISLTFTSAHKACFNHKPTASPCHCTLIWVIFNVVSLPPLDVQSGHRIDACLDSLSITRMSQDSSNHFINVLEDEGRACVISMLSMSSASSFIYPFLASLVFVFFQFGKRLRDTQTGECTWHLIPLVQVSSEARCLMLKDLSFLAV